MIDGIVFRAPTTQIHHQTDPVVTPICGPEAKSPVRL